MANMTIIIILILKIKRVSLGFFSNMLKNGAQAAINKHQK